MSNLQKKLNRIEELADIVEPEIPEFAKVAREAVTMIRTWDD